MLARGGANYTPHSEPHRRTTLPSQIKTIGTLDFLAQGILLVHVQADRGEIRDRAQLLITNPDMLHLSILPVHRSFSRILASLKYVVVDEGHAYKYALSPACFRKPHEWHLPHTLSVMAPTLSYLSWDIHSKDILLPLQSSASKVHGAAHYNPLMIISEHQK